MGTTTFSHTGTASSTTNYSDSLNFRITWDYTNSGGTTTFNITKIEIKDDGFSQSYTTGYVELGITVNGVRIIDVSTFTGAASVAVTTPGEWMTVTYSGSTLTGSGTFTTPANGSMEMVLSNSTKEQYPYPGVYYNASGANIFYLKTSLSQTIVQPTTYTISYNANGYGTAPSSQTKTYGVDLTLRPFISNVSSTGYEVSYNANGGSSTPSSSTSTIARSQTYWNTNSSGTGTNYASGGTYSANSAATLYAIWKATNGSITLASAISRANSTENGYTVTFDANGGSCATTSLTATNTRKYTFSKWAAGSASGTTYSAGASFTPTAATTMYATWTSSISSYGSITLPTPTRAGYTFKGWATSPDATAGNTGSYKPTGSVTLYAIWEAAGAIRVRVSGTYKMAQVWAYIGGKWKLTLPYTKKGSAWKLSG